MISYLKIKNFQKHKNLELSFTEGLNTIVGSSSKGKSGIVKAIKWLYLNTPAGLTFKNKFAKGPVEITDGKLTHFRNTSKHYYELNGNTYSALNREVPQDIKDYCNLSPLNFLNQHEPYYFISTLTKTQRSGLLLELVGLGEINSIKNNIREDLNEINNNIRYINKELESVDEGIKSLEFIKDVESRINWLDKTKSTITTLERKADLLHKLIRLQSNVVDLPSDSRLQSLRDNFNNIENKAAKIGLIIKILNVKEIQVPSIKHLTKLKDDLYLLYAKLDILKAILDIEEISIPDITDIQNSLLASFNYVRRAKILEDILNVSSQISEMETRINKFKDEKIEAAKFLKFCPACGRLL